MSEDQREPEMVSLNELARVLKYLSAGDLKSLLGSGELMAGCKSVDCDCNDIMCGCRNVKQPFQEQALSYEEFNRVREQRIEELHKQLKMLEGGKRG